MSILTSILAKNKIYIATDTLVVDVTEKSPAMFRSKTQYYPHLNCCVVAIGPCSLGDKHYQFVNERLVLNINDLASLTEKEFLPKYEIKDWMKNPRLNNVGFLVIFGMCPISMELAVYAIALNGDGSVDAHKIKLDTAFVFNHPTLPGKLESLITSKMILEGLSINETLIMYAQAMQDDAIRHDPDDVCVGGELHAAEMYILDGRFHCNFSQIYRFPNYDEDLDKINAYSQDNVSNVMRVFMNIGYDKSKI